MMRFRPVVVGLAFAACGGTPGTPARPRPPDPMTSPPHACEPFAESLPATPIPSESTVSYYATRHGCECASGPNAPVAACGSFPCTPGGCYVATCRIDSDCAHGLCSRYASHPHGYCVRSDPK